MRRVWAARAGGACGRLGCTMHGWHILFIKRRRISWSFLFIVLFVVNDHNDLTVLILGCHPCSQELARLNIRGAIGQMSQGQDKVRTLYK